MSEGIDRNFLKAYRGQDTDIEFCLTNPETGEPQDLTGADVLLRVSEYYGSVNFYDLTTGVEITLTDPSEGKFVANFTQNVVDNEINREQSNITVVVTFPTGEKDVTFKGWILYLTNI